MKLLQMNNGLSVLFKRRAITVMRTLLSPAYSCENEWQKRTESGLLSKVNSDKLFAEINGRFSRKQKVGAVDIDLFVNTVTSEEHLQDCKHILLKFRKTRRTKDTLESTHHAVVRAFIKYNQADTLLDVLNKRVDYGIFPDQFCYNLLLDHFIEQKNFKNASRVAVLRMLQEDFDNRIANILSLYSVYTYLREQQSTASQDDEPAAGEESEADDDDEPTYVRVPYLRNPFFDDHFDIKNYTHLYGKTLYLVGKQFDDIVGRTSQLYGLCLYNKWEKGEKMLKEMSEKFASDMFTSDLMEKCALVVESLAESEKESGVNFLDSLKKYEKRASNEDVYTLVCEKLKEIGSLEENDMKVLTKSFGDWQTRRDEALDQQMFDLMREEKLKEIKAKIQEMKEKERVLYFFENINKHEIEYVEAEKKIAEQKAMSVVDDDYVPPTIRK